MVPEAVLPKPTHSLQSDATVMLRVCKESREVALEYYHYLDLTFKDPAISTFINLREDILYCFELLEFEELFAKLATSHQTWLSVQKFRIYRLHAFSTEGMEEECKIHQCVSYKQLPTLSGGYPRHFQEFQSFGESRFGSFDDDQAGFRTRPR